MSRAGNKGKCDPKTSKKVKDRISAVPLAETGKDGDLEGEGSRQGDQNSNPRPSSVSQQNADTDAL